MSSSPLQLTISTLNDRPTGGLKVTVGGYVVEVEVEGAEKKPVAAAPIAAVVKDTPVFELGAIEVTDLDAHSAPSVESAEAGAEECDEGIEEYGDEMEEEDLDFDEEMTDAPALEHQYNNNDKAAAADYSSCHWDPMVIDSEYSMSKRAGPVAEAHEIEDELDWERQVAYQASYRDDEEQEHHHDASLDSVLSLLEALTLTSSSPSEPETRNRLGRRANRITKRTSSSSTLSSSSSTLSSSSSTLSSSSSSARSGKAFISPELMSLIQAKALEKREVEVSMKAFESMYQVRIV